MEVEAACQINQGYHAQQTGYANDARYRTVNFAQSEGAYAVQRRFTKQPQAADVDEDA